MSDLLSRLIQQDVKLKSFINAKEVIQQGLGPLLSLKQNSISLQKNKLLEEFKLQNWQKKAKLLFEELKKKQIKFLVFKGFAFTHLLYNHGHLRPYSDIDIITDQSDYSAVVGILKQQGYQQYPSRQGKFVSFQNSFFDNSTPKTIFDVHWQINNRIEFHQHFSFSDLYASAIDLNAEQFIFKSLDLVDAFILGCFHYQAHRANDRKHIWLYDLALLWHKMDFSLQEKCLEKAKTTQQSAIVLNTLSLLEKIFVGSFEFSFDLSPLQEEATGYYLQQRENKISDIKTRIKNIKGIKNKTKFIAEYVFQSRNYVCTRYQLKSNTWLFFYYPKMWFEDFFKLFKNP